MAGVGSGDEFGGYQLKSPDLVFDLMLLLMLAGALICVATGDYPSL